MLSVLILTKNEEADLPGCLASVSFSDDVHVLDSESSDATVDIARSLGAKVHLRRFDTFSGQRNYGLHQIAYKYQWLLILDADERIPPDLCCEIQCFLLSAPDDVCACRIRRRDFFYGKWLKHAAISQHFIRLVRPDKVRYEREVNEVLKVDGRIHDLRQPFDHFPFSKGMKHWFDKHNNYSTMEAKVIVESRNNKSSFFLWKAFFAHDVNERRYHQKGLFYRMPFRPLVKWLYMMFVRRAFLDGWPGITYAFLQSIYEYMIVLKTRELEKAGERKP
jgi:glycosyltransferase involved in cell wall biosynthesis